MSNSNARQVTPMPATRRITMAALRAGRNQAPMHGLIELDVTDARRRIAQLPEDISFTAFIVACVARAAASHPEVHAYRDWRGRLVTHSCVDVNTMVEVATSQGPFPLAVVVRDAEKKSVAEITAELRAAQARPQHTTSGRLLGRGSLTLARFPTLLAIGFRLAARSVAARRKTGTLAVTAVGMFGGGPGFGIGNPTIYSLSIVVGGISRRPREVDEAIEVRDTLDLTVSVDHNMVDGAPAARFVADLRRYVESAVLLETAQAVTAD